MIIMTNESSNDIEIRKLPPASVYQLSNLLEGDGWKQLMSVIPVDCKEGNPPKYTSDDMKLIENEGAAQRRMCSEILLEEWGISGRHRPTLSVLVRCLLKADQYRAACHVAEKLLKVPPPLRPREGPGKEVTYPVEPNNICHQHVIANQNVSTDQGVNSDQNLATDPGACPLPIESQSSMLFRENPTESVRNESFELQRISFADLEKFTFGFADSLVLGRGAFGIVYQANLPVLGAVAVKRFVTDGPGGAAADPVRQFHNEVEVLTKLTHPNLLPLLGYSDDGPALCLAYKYMRYGSLLARLAIKVPRSVLPWRTRVEIGLGTARGLSYLHTALEKPLVHRDVKSANILLDDNFTPKLGDFGLVRLGSTGTDYFTANPIGTSAYMAPECHRGDVSIKMDIFSFGVVLLELITGLPPIIIDDLGHQHDIVTHWIDTEDHTLLLDKTAGNWPSHVVIGLFQLADLCLSQRKVLRPNTSSIIETLDSCLV